MLSEDQVRSSLSELCATFGRPFGTDGAADATLVGAWRRALSDCEPDEVRFAVLKLVKDTDKFPTPKSVRSLAFWIRAQKRREAQEQREQNDEPLPFCSRCNARQLITDPWGRYRPLHADNCPGLHPEDLNIQRVILSRMHAGEAAD